MEKFYNFLFWLKDRLKESSTWTWLVVLAGYFGYTLNPELIEYIAGAVVSVITLIQFIKSDKVELKDNNSKTSLESSSELKEDKSE